MKLRAVILGCGNIAGGYDSPPDSQAVTTHAKAYQLNDSVELVGACDPDAKRAEEFCNRWKVAQSYTNVDDLFRDVKPDLVSVCAPNEVHYSLVLKAVHAGARGILCEKPIALSIQDARSMLRACKENQVRLLVNYTRRWNSKLIALGEDLRAGKFGRVQNAKVYYTKGVFHNASHAINLLQNYLGKGKVTSVWNAYEWQKDDLSASFAMSFDRCGDVVFQGCDADRFNFFEIELVTDEGRILLEGSTIQIRRRKGQTLSEPDRIDSQAQLTMKNVINDLVESVQQGREVLMPVEDAITTIEICENVRDLSRQGG